MPIADWQDKLKNDFEDSVFKKYPAIKGVKNKLYNSGAMYASMSGSGSAVFGIFENEIDLKKQFQEMVYWSGTL